MKKELADKLFWVLLVVMGLYLLYQKGIIGANFESISPKVAYEMLQDDNNITLLDVRTIEEFKRDGKIADERLIPLGELSKNLDMLDKSKKILVFCRSGNRSVSAARILENSGFTVINISGGMNAWRSAKLPVQ